jgi:hypothetical protein
VAQDPAVTVLPAVALCLGVIVVGEELHGGGPVTWIAAAVLAALLTGLSWPLVGDSAGEPLLLIGRVTRGVTVIAYSAVDRPSSKKLVMRWLDKGSLGAATVEVEAAVRLTPEGGLRVVPWLSGEVGMRWRAARRLIEGERCVLVCAANGLILDRLSDFATTGAAAGPGHGRHLARR